MIIEGTKQIKVETLIELLQQVPEGAVIIPNNVKNLAIYHQRLYNG